MKVLANIFFCIFFFSIRLFSQVEKEEFVEKQKDTELRNRIQFENPEKRLSVSSKDLYLRPKTFGKIETKFNPEKNKTQKLDSLVTEHMFNTTTGEWKLGNKEQYEYNSRGSLIKESHAYFNPEMKSWIKFTKDEYEYDENENEILLTGFIWNAVTNLWDRRTKRECDYNDKGDLIELANYNWDINLDLWTPYEKYVYLYDDNLDCWITLTYGWDPKTDQWKFYNKYESYFDNNGNNVMHISSYWSTYYNSLINMEMALINYDEQDKLLSYMYYNWNQESGQWEVTNKTEYLYDDEGNKTEKTDYRWDKENVQWIITYLMIWKYDANNDWIRGEFGNERYTENKYDSYRNLIERNSFVWGWGKWIPERRDEYQYNNYYTVAELLLPLKQVNPINYWQNLNDLDLRHMITTHYYTEWWYEGKVQDTSYYKDSFYYSEKIVTDVPDNTYSSIKIYPNPADEYFIIEKGNTGPGKIELFDFQGIKVLMMNFTGKVQIPAIQLKSGLYFCRINSNNRFYYGKIVVR